MELLIDTSTRYASVGLSIEGAVVAELSWRSERNHSVEFAPALCRVMDQAVVGMDALDAVIVARGPGAFSALRVGMSVAKSLAMARSIPLVAVGSLDVEAGPYLGLGYRVCSLIGAGRSSLYRGTYAGGVEPLAAVGDYEVIGREDVAAGVREKTLFCGEGAPSVTDLLRDRLGDKAIIAESSPPTRRSGALAALGFARLSRSDTDHPDSIQPIYMNSAQITSANRYVKANALEVK